MHGGMKTAYGDITPAAGRLLLAGTSPAPMLRDEPRTLFKSQETRASKAMASPSLSQSSHSTSHLGTLGSSTEAIATEPRHLLALPCQVGEHEL